MAVVVVGAVLTRLICPEDSVCLMLCVWLKFAFGLLLVGGGFMLLVLNTCHGAADSQISMGMMVVRLAVMGFVELLIDPVVTTQIAHLNIPGITGMLVGAYMLTIGAVVNWLAGTTMQQTTES